MVLMKHESANKRMEFWDEQSAVLAGSNILLILIYEKWSLLQVFDSSCRIILAFQKKAPTQWTKYYFSHCHHFDYTYHVPIFPFSSKICFCHGPTYHSFVSHCLHFLSWNSGQNTHQFNLVKFTNFFFFFFYEKY